ncbi:poly(hydroxyalkanoate) depolymerase family esterase [Kribbella sp. VKM Ac-2527]|uniref:Poly(Hydroxyalkanoate) depolymerase family esterase n=1 Tax=Kribbella caucasensis TaxID=2512215 RepID=A0A4R6JJ11_9ACTN|nr:PHB depolymerase family esterase [Kribbella sp. VKM Ac-2527]TDO35121.1 poly(hydroxyalkanoate) depolymerase family esterase [Kribbella sp. VKM Ac-2527]
MSSADGIRRWSALGAAVLAVVALLVAAPAPVARAAGLEEVTGFGTNPGNLRMFRYVPSGLAAGRPLVVALHGCTQSAAAFDAEPGWIEVAERMQFALLLPQQQSANNANSCFNWFEPADTSRGSGEALSIKQMVDRMRSDQGSDAAKTFVTGLSAGGAMTAVMLATYPEVFAAGAVVAGLPYRCAGTVVQAFSCMSPGTNLTPQQWGDKVRAASSHTGPWPTISLWHGTADSTVAYSNLNELTEQWTNVHTTDQTADVSDTVNGYPRKGYRDSTGRLVVETYSITGMNHGQPINPGSGAPYCGTPAPYILDVDICAAGHIAGFWGLEADPTAPQTQTFSGIESQDGYVKANQDGSSPSVGTLANLAVGRGTDGKHNRALLSFDTSAIPDDATISRAWLTVTHSSGSGDPWAGGNRLLADLRTGCFGACATEASDWAGTPTATAVASLASFSSGSRVSSDLSPGGLGAINRTGTTQLKLRFDQPPASTAYRFLQSGTGVTLTIVYG